mgnify:CR=1 FL=1
MLATGSVAPVNIQAPGPVSTTQPVTETTWTFDGELRGRSDDAVGGGAGGRGSDVPPLRGASFFHQGLP